MLQTKFTTNHNKLPFSLNYSTKHPHLLAWLLGCFTSILEIIGTSIKKGKMMIYEDEGYLNECLNELPPATYSDGKKYMKKQGRKNITFNSGVYLPCTTISDSHECRKSEQLLNYFLLLSLSYQSDQIRLHDQHRYKLKII